MNVPGKASSPVQVVTRRHCLACDLEWAATEPPECFVCGLTGSPGALEEGVNQWRQETYNGPYRPTGTNRETA